MSAESYNPLWSNETQNHSVLSESRAANLINQGKDIDGTLLPRGNGKKVLLVNGLFSTPASMIPLGGFLRNLNYDTQYVSMYPYVNLGLPDQWRQVRETAERLAEKQKNPIDVIGWSLGGLEALYAAQTGAVKIVETMGSPFAATARNRKHVSRSQSVNGYSDIMNTYFPKMSQQIEGYMDQISNDTLPDGVERFVHFSSSDDEVVNDIYCSRTITTKGIPYPNIVNFDERKQLRDWEGSIKPSTRIINDQVLGMHIMMGTNWRIMRGVAYSLALPTQPSKNAA